MKKKGQVTIFVILGLIVFILVFLSILFLFQGKEKPDPSELMSNENRALIQPIERDISYCLKELGQDALNEIGLRGGHVVQENTMYNLEPAYSNNAVELIHGSDMIIPFWAYYDGAPDCLDCELILDIPELEGKSKYTIQSQVQKHINENMLSCVNNFDAYKDFDITSGEIKSEVIFATQGVSLKLDWPINIVLGTGENLSINKFSNKIDLNFKKIYELSKTLFLQLLFLDEEPHIERTTSHILQMMSIQGENAPIPPVIRDTVSGTTSYKFWLLSQTKDLIQEVLQENANYIQIKGLKDSYVFATNDDLHDSIYREFEFEPIIKDYDYLQQTKIRFHYFKHFPTYLKITPGKELITPQKVPFKIPLLGDLGNTMYEYSYDMMYPLVIIFEDTQAYDGKGYTFQFATTVNIYNNAPKELDFENVPDIEMQEEDFLEGGFGSLDQRTVPVQITVVDGYTELPITDMPISYSCGNREIFLGQATNKESYTLNTMVPPCVDGTFYVDNYEVLSEIITKNIEIDESYEFDLKVYFEREVPISLKTLRFAPTNIQEPTDIESSRQWEITTGGAGQGISPYQEEEIILAFSRMNENAKETEFFKILNLKNGISNDVIKLVPGQYEITIVSTLNLGEDNITIKEKNYTVKTATGLLKIKNFFTGDSNTELVTLPEITFNKTMFLGNLELKGEQSPSITKEDIIGNKEIMLIYPTYDFEELKYHQDLEVIEQISNVTKEYPESFGCFIK